MIEQFAPRKIALVGTGCVGKTKIYDSLLGEFRNDPRIAFVDEAARIYFTQHPEIPEELRFSFQPQSEIQSLAHELEQRVYNLNVDTIITDRSVLDAAVYVNVHGDRVGSRMLIDRMRDWIPTYSHILLFDPADVPYKPDYVRKESPAVRQRNHEGYLKVFMEEGIQYELVGGTLEQRIGRVRELAFPQQ